MCAGHTSVDAYTQQLKLKRKADTCPYSHADTYMDTQMKKNKSLFLRQFCLELLSIYVINTISKNSLEGKSLLGSHDPIIVRPGGNQGKNSSRSETQRQSHSRGHGGMLLPGLLLAFRALTQDVSLGDAHA